MKVWHEWLSSDEGRKAIPSFRIGGEQLFFSAGTTPKSEAQVSMAWRDHFALSTGRCPS